VKNLKINIILSFLPLVCFRKMSELSLFLAEVADTSYLPRPVISPHSSSNNNATAGPSSTPTPVPPPVPPPLPQQQPSVMDPLQNKVHGHEPMEQDTTKKSQVNQVLHQVREARKAATTAQVTFVKKCENGQTYQPARILLPSIGQNLEQADKAEGTFLGARMYRGRDRVDQTISSSFDPANLSCLMCDK